MRTVSMKSLCVLVGFLVPGFGVESRAEAGVIPWLYDSIFGYGWGGSGYGGGYAGGYGGGLPYTAGYGGYGYGGYGYGSGMSYAAPQYSNPGCCTPSYSTPTMAAPVISTPTAPADGNIKTYYGPSLGDYDSGYDGYSYSVGYAPTYSTGSDSCCNPCSPCSTGDSGTSIESAKPAANPTPIDSTIPNSKKSKGLPPDSFAPTRNGGAGAGAKAPVNGGEAMPPGEAKPAKQFNNGGVERDEMEAPVDEEGPPAGTIERGQLAPTDHNIAVRYLTPTKRARIALPIATARVVRIDRALREQLVHADPKPQLASNP